LLEVLSNCGNDKLIPNIVWQNLHPLLESQVYVFASQSALLRTRNVAAILPRVLDRILAHRKPSDAPLIANLFLQLQDSAVPTARQYLKIIAARVQAGELRGDYDAELRRSFEPVLMPLVKSSDDPLYADAAMLQASWGHMPGLRVAEAIAADPQKDV